MGSYKKEDELANWDPRKEDFMDRRSSTIYGSNFTRTNNLARNKETVHEPHGLYVRNIPLGLDESSLQKMFSEHGKVLSVYIGKHKPEFDCTWGLIKVESMKDAMAMISALNMKLPLKFKVEISLTEEERMKRRKEKEMARNNSREMEGLVANRLSIDSLHQRLPATLDANRLSIDSLHQRLPATLENSSENQVKGLGRGKMLSSLVGKSKENQIGSGDHTVSSRNEDDIKEERSLVSITDVYSDAVNESKEKVVVETNIGNVVVGWRKPRPCVADDCKNMGKLRCSVCKAFYCSKECQVDDWFYHQSHCKKPPLLEDFNIVSTSSPIPEKTETAIVPTIETLTNGMGLTKSTSENNNTSAKFVDPTTSTVETLRNEQCFTKSTIEKIHTLTKPFDPSSPLVSDEEQASIWYTNAKESKKILENCENLKVESVNTSGQTSQVKLSSKASRSAVGKLQGNLRRPFLKVEEKTSKNVQDEVPHSEDQKNKSVNSLNSNVSPTRTMSPKVMTMSLMNSPKMGTNSLSTVAESVNQLKGTSPDAHNKKQSTVSSDRTETDLENFPSLIDHIELNSIVNGLMNVKESCTHFIATLFVQNTETLLVDANTVLGNAPSMSDFNPIIGSLVAAMSEEDFSWYRACLYNREAGFYDVLFIDFGNKERVKEVKPLPEGLFTNLPGLAVVAKYHGDRDAEIVKSLDGVVVGGKDVSMKILGKKSKSIKVSLLVGDKDTKANFILRPWYTAVPLSKEGASTKGSVSEKNIHQGRSSEENNASDDKDIYSVSPSKFIEISSQNSLEKSINYSPYEAQGKLAQEEPSKFWQKDLMKEVIEVGHKHDVVPVWVEDDNTLFVQVASSAKCLQMEDLMTCINEQCEKGEIPSSLEVGELVCGCVEGDPTWYRAVVLQIEEEKITVQFIDFGNTDVIGLKKLRLFCFDLMKIPTMAVPVKLARVSSDDSKAKDHLLNLVTAGRILRLQSSVSHPTTFELFDQETHLNDTITSQLDVKKLENIPKKSVVEETFATLGEKTPSNTNNVASSPTSKKELTSKRVVMYEDCKMSSLATGNEISVVVVHVGGPLGIFLVAFEEVGLYEDLEKLSVLMKEYCESLACTLYRPQQGEICLAKFSEDGMWYRAACLQPGLDNSFVIFVDYGNIEEVKMSDLREIQDPFLKLPCIARQAVLKGVSIDGIQDAAKDRIIELMPSNSPFNAKVDIDDDGVYIIDVPSVFNTLISEGLIKAE